MAPLFKKGIVLTVDGKRYTVTRVDKVYTQAPTRMLTWVKVEAVLVQPAKPLEPT
jgi:hypothetical protein